MRIGFILFIIVFLIGVLVGDRFGAPGFLKNAASGGLGAVGKMIGRTDGEDAVEAPVGSDAGAEEDGPQAAAAPPATYSGVVGNPANANLRINDAGLNIIKESEGLRLEAYNVGGQWLIGYGHSGSAYEGMTITAAEADALLRDDVVDAENAVRKQVLTPVNVNQFSAMVSLAYNLGAGGFSNTSVVARVNAGDYAGAAEAFLLHDRARINGVLTPQPNLAERRQKERALFLS